MSSLRKSLQAVGGPNRHQRPSMSLPSPLGGGLPVVVLDTPLANRFAGFSVIASELATAREMLDRARSESDQLLVSALWRAGVAIYARCFTSTAIGMPKLEERDHLQGATAELEALHTLLIATRHGFLSHAGYSDVERSSAQVVLSDPRSGLGIVMLAAARSVTSVPPADQLPEIVRLVELVSSNVQISLRASHARALEELRATPLADLYAMSQSLSGA